MILVLLLLISVFLQIGEGWLWYQAGEANCGTQLKISSWFTTTITCLICYEVVRLKKRNLLKLGKPLVLIGDYSFGIYLCHIAVMIVLNHVPGYRRIPYVANSVIVLTISLLCCVIGDKICRKIKAGSMNLSQVMGLKWIRLEALNPRQLRCQ